jgi:hypothetical protein
LSQGPQHIPALKGESPTCVNRSGSKYRGNHYVEVYIVKGERCVALSRQRAVVL